MKNLIVCGLLVLATGGGVAFVVANRPPPVPPSEVGLPAVEAAPTEPAVCAKCQTGSTGVTDVTDLSAQFAAKSDARGEFVSFDEPPLAKPKADVTAVGHEVPEVREVLPPPREVK